jgi:hypothetical protein
MAQIPLDIRRQVCLYLNHTKIKEVAPYFYHDEHDPLWTMMLDRIKDVEMDERPEGMSRRAFYEYLYYEKPMRNKDWSPYYIKKYMKDEIFLQRHIDTRDSRGFTILIELSSRGDAGDLAHLLHLGADINAQTYNGYTALIFSCFTRGKYENFKTLLDSGADINTTTYRGRTALWYAVRHSVEITKLLLSRGADATVRTRNGSIMSHAKQSRNPEIIELIRKVLDE